MATKKTTKPAAKKTAAKKPTVKKVTAKKTSAKVEDAVNEVVEDVTEAYEDIKEDVVEALEDAKEEAASLADNVKASLSKTQESAQQAWLASLGVVGRSADEIKERVAQLKENRESLMTDLIARGEKVQDDAQARIKANRVSIEEQIEMAKKRLPDFTAMVDVPARLQDISDKLKNLSNSLKKSA